MLLSSDSMDSTCRSPPGQSVSPGSASKYHRLLLGHRHSAFGHQHSGGAATTRRLQRRYRRTGRGDVIISDRFRHERASGSQGCLPWFGARPRRRTRPVSPRRTGAYDCSPPSAPTTAPSSSTTSLTGALELVAARRTGLASAGGVVP